MISCLKKIKKTDTPFEFPMAGESKHMDLCSEDKKHEFIVDVNRRGSINLTTKCTYQGRYQRDTILMRLDINGPPHTNPDGSQFGGTHLHIYHEGLGDRVAIQIPNEFVHKDSLIDTLIDFLTYFKAVNASQLEIQGVI